MHNGVELSPAVRRLAQLVAAELAAVAADHDALPQVPAPGRADLEDAACSALRWACQAAFEYGDPIDPVSLGAAADRVINNQALRAQVTIPLLEAFCAVVRDPDKPPDRRWCKPIGPLSWVPPDESDRWLLEGLVLRGEPQLLAGPPKSNKTWIGLAIAMAAATGADLQSWRNTRKLPARVLVISLEDSEEEARARLSQLLLGAYPNHLERQEAERKLGEHLALSTLGVRLPDSASLTACVEECRVWQPELVVVDNLTRIFDGDPNSTRDASAVTNRWADLSRELHAAILMLHHTSKSAPNETRDPFDRIRGSGDFLAVARNACVVERIGETDVLDLRIRGNRQIKRDRIALELEHTPSQHLDGWLATAIVDRGDPEELREAAAEQKATSGRKRKAEARKLEEQQLFRDRVTTLQQWIGASGPVMSTAAVAAILDISKAQAARVVQRMLAGNAICRDDRTGAYTLPEPQ